MTTRDEGLTLTGPRLDRLAKARRKVENAQAGVRAAQRDLQGAIGLLDDALHELHEATEGMG